MALHAVSPAAAASPPRALSSARLPLQRPGRTLLPPCLPSRLRDIEAFGTRESYLRTGCLYPLCRGVLCTGELARITGCGCLSKRPTLLSSSTIMKLHAGTVGFFSMPLVLRHSDKRAVLMHATIEEIEAEKSVIEDQAKERMEKAIETVQNNFNTVRTGRANPSMLDRIEVEYYGTPVNLKSIAQINTPDATSLLIQPYDKSCLKLIEKAIVAANLGVTPSNDGEVIRITVPPLTSDRRKELTKTVGKLAEEGKVTIRNIRRDAIKAYDKLEKEKKLSEDNVKDLSADLQKVTDEYMKKIEAIQKQKEQELMKI